MRSFKDYIVSDKINLKTAMRRLDNLGGDSILFAVNKTGRLIGSLTDGDIRRGLLNGYSPDDLITTFLQQTPKCIIKNKYSLFDLLELRNKHFEIIPVLDDNKRIVNIINFRFLKSYLPLDALVMAGGRGTRLKPLTDKTPKPLLMVGEKPIIDHNIDRLSSFGIDDFHISLGYLGEQIEDHYRHRNIEDVNINFIYEKKPLGTLGAASLIDSFKNEFVLITNSDILTNLDYEDFFLDFLKNKADMSVASIPYKVDIPYAVLETDRNKVKSFKEKPTYTYYSNGGIYLVKKSLLQYIPKDSFYNATDLMNSIILKGGNLISYPVRDYWLDVGRHEDYEKAHNDIKYLKL